MKRLIRTEYSGSTGDRVGRSSTLEGAVRAAIIRIAHGQYRQAVIFDDRFGTHFDTRAIHIGRTVGGIAVRYVVEAPRWIVEQGLTPAPSRGTIKVRREAH